MTTAGPDPALVARLVCPVTRRSLAFDPARQALVADGDGPAWPVADGVPLLVPDAGRRPPGAALSPARP